MKGLIQARGKSGKDIQEELMNEAQPLLLTETKAYALVHAVQAVRFAVLTGRKIEPDVTELMEPLLLQEVRIFNQVGELHLWRNGADFCWRLRLGSDPESDHIDRTCYLWGNRLDADGRTLIDSDRGMRIALPITGDPGLATHASYTVREYLTYDNDGNVSIQDARLVSVQFGGGV